jgi:hypothetical protein
MSSVVKLQKDILNNESRRKNPNLRIKKVYHVVAEEDHQRPQTYAPLPPLRPMYQYQQLPPTTPNRCNCPECKPHIYYPPASPHCNCAQCLANRDYYSSQYRLQPTPTPRYQFVESKPLAQINTAYRSRIDSPTPKTSLPPINRSSLSVLPNNYNDFEPGNAYNDSFNRVIMILKFFINTLY